ncbi:hypothetical protein Ahy_B06g086039 [Arachis hypogaea]|uniref:Wall-associated receptor kinase galacturonan-binding domain-containing protein n=1 Tax=Arachis hypogaea TaxID=3818 RepID=A0A444YWH6_ARAHY|nr:hypothetical protein Ahy_B06g086039 [Arachis hypogaea]
MTMEALFILLLLLNFNLINIGISHRDPVQCPVRLYCTKNETNILELPGVSSSVKLPVRHINFKSKTLEVYAAGICLSELFLKLNYSSFDPFRFIRRDFGYSAPGYDENYPLKPTNITFFHCPSSNSEYTRLPCRIQAADDDDGVVRTNLVRCRKLSHQVLPMHAEFIRDFSFYLVWSETNFHSGCFVGCKMPKGTQYYESIILPVIGAALLFSTLAALIAKKLAIVGLWCIQWHPVHRPSMKSVVQMLEGEESKLKVPPNPFESAAATSSSAIIPARRLNLELEVIPETD